MPHTDPDSENPPFDFGDVRERRDTDPRSSETAKAYRVLRDIVSARRAGEPAALEAALKAAENLVKKAV
ncbi:MAG: hypothetical protein ACU0CO_13450 [Shimia sp.]